MKTQDVDVDIQELAEALEPVIRRIIREELERLLAKSPEPFPLYPDSPLYGDLMALREERENGSLEFHSHDEVWGDE
jgi:hypothetical protein